jgi:hypothetical protein
VKQDAVILNMQLVQNHCSHKSEQGEVCALQGSVIGVTLPEGWGQTQEEKFAEGPFSVSSAPVSDGGKHGFCSSQSCLVFSHKCLKIKLMSIPVAGGREPWPPSLVIFLLDKETGCLTSGGDLGALGWRTSLPWVTDGLSHSSSQTSGPASRHM